MHRYTTYLQRIMVSFHHLHNVAILGGRCFFGRFLGQDVKHIVGFFLLLVFHGGAPFYWTPNQQVGRHQVGEENVHNDDVLVQIVGDNSLDEDVGGKDWLRDEHDAVCQVKSIFSVFGLVPEKVVDRGCKTDSHEHKRPILWCVFGIVLGQHNDVHDEQCEPKQRN